jgi:hypothetical protein
MTILQIVLYGFKMRSSTCFEENMNYKSYNKVPRKMFGPKRDEIGEKQRILYNKELHDMQKAPSILTVVKCD